MVLSALYATTKTRTLGFAATDCGILLRGRPLLPLRIVAQRNRVRANTVHLTILICVATLMRRVRRRFRGRSE
jgi:hypothetical protein